MQVYLPTDINEIAFELRNNKAVILPTDTVWGIISLTEKNIYQIKQRSSDKKIITFIDNIKELDLPKKTEKQIAKYWPGALTIIWKNQGYRIPKSSLLLALMAKVGPLFSSSANISGQKPITKISQAKKIFKDREFELALVNDPNFKLSNTPSTIIDLDKNLILREGKIDGKKILASIKRG